MEAATSRRPRIVYFGTTGRLSAPPLRALLDAGMDVCAVVLQALTTGAGVAPIAPLPFAATPAAPPTAISRSSRLALPMAGTLQEHNIITLARQRHLPLFEVARLAHPRTLATLAAFSPDLICVACFPRRLPPALLALPRWGGINLHPSLLPDNRGPDPLFWTFQRGQRTTGVTIHRMDAGLDTGPILAQEPVLVREGIDEATLERGLAERGALLMVRTVEGLAAGQVRDQPQDEARATRFGWPTPADHEISPQWPALRAYAFACGIRHRAQPALVRLAGTLYTVRKPLTYDDQGALGDAWQLDGDILLLQCAPGIVRARIAATT